MTLFEYLAIPFSLVLSFAVIRLVGGLVDAFDPQRRYWIHALWVVFELLAAAGLWWNLWSFHSVEWSFLRFSAVLAIAGLFYFGACAMIPANPAAVACWRQHFQLNRRRFFGAGLAWLVVVLWVSHWILALPVVHPVRALQALMFGGCLLGFAQPGERVQGALVLTALLLWPLAMLTLFLSPGALGAR